VNSLPLLGILPRARSALKDFGTTVSDKDDAHNELLIFQRVAQRRLSRRTMAGWVGSPSLLTATQRQYGWMFLRAFDEG
jgi:hypothetical protein